MSQNPPPGGGVRFARITAVLLVVGVVAEYIAMLRHGHWPTGHPWSGLALVCLAGVFASVGNRRRALVASALAVVASILWVWANHARH